MKKSTIIITNLVVNVLMTLLFIKLNSGGNGRHGYENAITFAFWCGSALVVQLVANLCFAIYFFVKKDNEKAKTFLLTMLLLCLVAFISFYSLTTVGFN